MSFVDLSGLKPATRIEKSSFEKSFQALIRISDPVKQCLYFVLFIFRYFVFELIFFIYCNKQYASNKYLPDHNYS